MNVAGIGSAKRIVGKDGSPAPLEDFFERVVRVNLIGTYNITRPRWPRWSSSSRWKMASAA